MNNKDKIINIFDKKIELKDNKAKIKEKAIIATITNNQIKMRNFNESNR